MATISPSTHLACVFTTGMAQMPLSCARTHAIHSNISRLETNGLAPSWTSTISPVADLSALYTVCVRVAPPVISSRDQLLFMGLAPSPTAAVSCVTIPAAQAESELEFQTADGSTWTLSPTGLTGNGDIRYIYGIKS